MQQLYCTLILAMAEYPVKAGYYDRSELSRLCSCVGFPGNFLTEGLKSSPDPRQQSAHLRLLTSSNCKPVSDKLLHELLKSRHMRPGLEKVFNKYPADCNRRIFVRAMSHLKHGRLGYMEISDARVAFEAHMCEDGMGMFATVGVVLQALKMLERVMAPSRLETEIQKQQAVVDVPSRIQMHEFLELVVRSARWSQAEEEVASPIAEAAQTDPSELDLSIPDFGQLLMTKEQRLLDHLDQQYKDSLCKRKASSKPPTAVASRTVTSSPREEARASSQRQREALMPALEYSQHQLLRARVGFAVFLPMQHRVAEQTYASRQSSRASTRCGTSATNSPQHWRFDRSGRSSRAQSRGAATPTSTTPVLPRPATTSMTPVLPRPATRDQRHRSHTQLPKSKSTPALPSLWGRGGGQGEGRDVVVVEDLCDEISKVCEKSVHGASHALRMSMTSIPQLSREDTQTSTDKMTASVRGAGGDEPAQPTRGEERVIRPVVSELEVTRHQGLIDELEWAELRRKWQEPVPYSYSYYPRPRSKTLQ